MKFEAGDNILLLLTGEEGKIVEIINKQMAMVEVNGVTFPVYLDQIDFPYFKRFTTKKSFPKPKLSFEDVRTEKTPARKPTNEGVFVHIFPVFEKDVFDDDVVEKLKIYLVNQNAEDYNFNYTYSHKEEVAFTLKNNIRAASDFYLHDVDFDDMSENPRFAFDFSLPKPDSGRIDHFESLLRIKARQLFKKIEEAKEKNEAYFSFLLFKDYPARPEEEKLDLSSLNRIGFYDASRAASYLPPPQSVIDLHIEKITHQRKGLSNAQILEMQLNHFEKYYESARGSRLPNLTVIHGVGEGVLRNEIHERLRQRRGVKSFVNQFNPLYGFGATEIYFEY